MSRVKWQQLEKLLSWAQKQLAQDRESQKACLLLQDQCQEKISQLPREKASSKADGAVTSFDLPQEVQLFPQAIALFTDGACRGNPGPGSWAAMAQAHYQGLKNDGDIIFSASGVDIPTTNNKMELTAALQGLFKVREYLTEQSLPLHTPILLFSDSKYVLDGLDKWVEGWKKRGWKKADNKVPENVELWKALDQINGELQGLRFHWVKGHAGHPQNEYVDKMANIALDEAGH